MPPLSCLRTYLSKNSRAPPQVGVIMSGGGVVFRGMLWIGIEGVCVDHKDRTDVPVGTHGKLMVCDAMQLSLHNWTKEHGIDFLQLSPPCPPGSTAKEIGGAPSKERQLIPEVQAMLVQLQADRAKEGLPPMPTVMENTQGSRGLMKVSITIDGQQIGSRANRRRPLELSGFLHLPDDGDLLQLTHSLQLCQGSRRKMPRRDDHVHGSNWHRMPPCCHGLE